MYDDYCDCYRGNPGVVARGFLGRKVVPDVLQEDGCLQYEPSIDVETNMEVQGETRPNTVVVVEKWESLEALEAHLVAPHMVAYRAKVKDLVNSVAIQVLEPATAG